MKNRHIKQLEVILKTVERCNLNCSYCYFFHHGDESYKQHPPFISAETIVETAKFLRQGCLDLGISKLLIEFHGGEPMLQSHSAFDHMCTTFKEHLSEHVHLLLTMQTNGTLVTDKWINLFSKHNVHIGISCDGPKENHDQFRLDHQGKGSFDSMAKGLKSLQKAHITHSIQPPGLLCVINPRLNGSSLFRYFRDELDVMSMDFLFPSVTYDTSREDPSMYGRFLCELFDAWIEEDNVDVKVRILESTLRLILGKKSILSTSGPVISDSQAITISSAGDIVSDDALRSTHASLIVTGKTVKNTTLSEILLHPAFEMIDHAKKHLPLACRSCCWQKICNGGDIVHRYKRENGFDNPSLMCRALKQFYAKVAQYVLDNGFSQSQLENVLLNI